MTDLPNEGRLEDAPDGGVPAHTQTQEPRVLPHFEVDAYAPVRDGYDVTLPPSMQLAVQRLKLAAEQRQRDARRRWVGLVINTIFGFSVFTFCVLMTTWVLDNDVPITSTTKLLTPVVYPGDKVKVRVHITNRTRLCDIQVTIDTYDGEGRVSTDLVPWRGPSSTTLGPDEPFERDVKIPVDATPGDSRLRFTRRFRCPYNPIQQRWPIVQELPEFHFTILTPPPTSPLRQAMPSPVPSPTPGGAQ